MANALTGAYDAVVEAGVTRINRILALQHQAGTFLHSLQVIIDDTGQVPKGRTPAQEVAPAAGLPFQEQPSAQEVASAAANPVQGRMPAQEPAGQASPVQEPRSAQASAVRMPYGTPQGWVDYTGAPAPHIMVAASHDGFPGWNYTGVRGSAQIQVSTPTLTLPADPNASRVTVHYQVMAHINLDPQSTPIPEFVHGDVQVTMDVSALAQVDSTGHTLQFSVASLDFLTGNVAITFTPSATLQPQPTAQDVSRIEQLIQNVLVGAFGSEDAVLPSAIKALQFKTLPAGALPAIALLFSLTQPLPDSARASVGSTFLQGGDDFALAVGREYLVQTLQDAVWSGFATYVQKAPHYPDDEFQNCSALQLKFDFGWLTYHYCVSLTGVSAELHTGEIWLTFQLHAQALNWFAPDLDLQVTQKGIQLRLVNDVVQVDTTTLPDPEVNFFGWLGPILNLFSSSVVGMITQQRSDMLNQANQQIQVLLSGLDFGTVLQDLHVDGAQLTYTSVEIQTEGVVLHGTLAFPVGWKEPVALTAGDMVQRNQAAMIALTAFDSWIPGGTVDRYTWASQTDGETVADGDRFLTYVPPTNANGPSTWCVLVSGTQTTDAGATTPVQKASCTIHSPVFGLVQRPAGRLVIPVIGPGPDPEAYIDPWNARLTSLGSAANLVVHFADAASAAGLAVFQDALAASGVAGSAVHVVVLRPSALRGHARPPAPAPYQQLTWSLTEDFEGNWGRTFALHQVPATFLVGASGRILWQRQGPVEAAALAAAFREHLVAGGPLQYRPMPLAVRLGMRAPDFRFEYAPGHLLAFRRFRGRPTLLTFWTSWAAPCLDELRSLQRIHERQIGETPAILAVNDGEDPAHAAAVFQQCGCTFTLVPDPTRQIAQRYGVHCWPTTITLDAQRVVSGLHFGRTPGPELFVPRPRGPGATELPHGMPAEPATPGAAAAPVDRPIEPTQRPSEHVRSE
jgi:peroxiredoxin